MINFVVMKKRTLLTIVVACIALLGVFALTGLDAPIKPQAQNQWLSEPFQGITAYDELMRAIDTHVVCLKNNQCLPLNDLNVPTVYVSLGGNSDALHQGIKRFSDGRFLQVFAEEDLVKLDTLKTERIILSLHPVHPDSLTINEWIWEALQRIPSARERIVLTFGKIPSQMTSLISTFDGILMAPENHTHMQDRISQQVMGAIPIEGKLRQGLGVFKRGTGIKVPGNGRLRFSTPEELKMQSSDFNRIDQLAKNGITSGAYPGCQIVVAVKGSIIYRKSFGNFTYESTSKKVENEDVYDIASITKIASSTLIAMKLHYEKKLDLNASLGTYIPEVTGETPYRSIIIREMMAHQAGLEPFIPFYKRTLSEEKPLAPWYSNAKDEEHGLEVANELFLKTAYKDSMYARILRNPLKEKKYVYSDLCYYFMQPIFEKITGEKQDQYVRNHIYSLMGLRYINYKPLSYYNKNLIVPTENDQYFRKQLLQGHVHDPGAALLGGVGGHAGLFSNATDLASIMQLFLNNGSYAGQHFFDKSTVTYFTKAQYTGNKRGIGFDRPSAAGGGTCDVLASQQSFGHSGFTGTLAWADPKNEVVFVFLSNRVHPSQDNWKLRDMGVRTNIQHVVYEIVNARYGK
jgi:CubicO group peptidase (beta-lactamase class C family)